MFDMLLCTHGHYLQSNSVITNYLYHQGGYNSHRVTLPLHLIHLYACVCEHKTCYFACILCVHVHVYYIGVGR